MAKKKKQTVYKVIGLRGILIQLEMYEDHTRTESGLYVPKYQDHHTDGGRVAAKITPEMFKTVGTIVQISDAARKELEKISEDLQVGDRVAVTRHSKHENNWFYENRDDQVTDYTGLILITPSGVEAKIV